MPARRREPSLASTRPGPLSGLTVVEFAGIGPGPYAGMLLADMGADVIRVDRLASPRRRERARLDLVNRGKRSVALDLKTDGGRAAAGRLIAAADLLIEGFRPGVMERLGLGPEPSLAANPKLIYGRMTGWGQTGPSAALAGHDINYISITGALWAIGRADDRPVPPLNLVGDYGGGSLFLVMGLLAALHAAQSSGAGQVVDAAIVDGVASLTAPVHAMRSLGGWGDDRADNLLDGAAPYYDVYECADGRFVAVGAIEPQFYAELVRLTGFRADVAAPGRFVADARADWPQAKDEWAAHFKTRRRDEWAALCAGSDACLSPVLDWDEAFDYGVNVERSVFADANGVGQPMPAPRFSRDQTEAGGPPPSPGQDSDAILAAVGYSEEQIAALRSSGAVS
jgi:alpha-methylacyl-CoA racemase